MAAGTALIALEPPAIDKLMLVTLATRSPVPVGPAGLLQSSLRLLLGAIHPVDLRRREAFLELDGTARHDLADIYVSVYAPSSPCAKRAG